MSVNLRHSRRTKPYRCAYWNSKDGKPYDEVVFEANPDGIFYAEIVGSESNRDQPTAGVILFNSTTVTIRTDDEIDIKKGATVLFDERKWRAADVQRYPHKRENRLSRKGHFGYFIQLKA